MSGRAAWRVWALALVLVGGARSASGESTKGAPAHDVPRECPARAKWLAALRGRLPLLLRTHPLVEAQRVHIERVAGAAGGYAGFLESGAVGSAARGPVVRGATCAEVIEVLGFMGALGLERIAGDAPAASDVLAASDPSRTSDPSGANEPSGASPAPASIEPAPLGVDGGAAGNDIRGASASSAGATLFAMVQSGIAPGWSLDFGAGARIGWSAPGWQPWLFFGVYSGRASEVSVDGAARVRFEHWSTQAVACPWRFPSQGAFGVRPCVDVDVGVTRGVGIGVARAEEHAAPWLSGGAQLRFELLLWDRVELGALLGAAKPLYHARFFIKPSSTAFETADYGVRTGTYASILF